MRGGGGGANMIPTKIGHVPSPYLNFSRNVLPLLLNLIPHDYTLGATMGKL